MPPGRPQSAVDAILDALWQLMDASLEELKVLQCVLALVSSAVNVHGPALSKARTPRGLWLPHVGVVKAGPAGFLGDDPVAWLYML